MDGGDEMGDDLAEVNALRLDAAVFVYGILFARRGGRNNRLKFMGNETFTRRAIADPVIGDRFLRSDCSQSARHG